jgi:hypothetical protein
MREPCERDSGRSISHDGDNVPNHEQLAQALYAAIGGVSALTYIGSLVWAVIRRMKANQLQALQA